MTLVVCDILGCYTAIPHLTSPSPFQIRQYDKSIIFCLEIFLFTLSSQFGYKISVAILVFPQNEPIGGIRSAKMQVETNSLGNVEFEAESH